MGAIMGRIRGMIQLIVSMGTVGSIGGLYLSLSVFTIE